MKKIHFSLLLIPLWSFAQEMETIQTDRPDQTECPAIVPRGMWQIETGFSFQRNDKNSKTVSAPSVLWKFGINENIELRLITEFEHEKVNGAKFSGLSPIFLGCKIKVSEEKGIWPKTSFIGHLSLPNAASSDFKTDYVAPEFRFTMQHTLTERMTLGYNLGAEWDGFSPKPTFIYTIATGFSVTDRLGTYVELFGFAPQNDTAYHSFDGGFTYLINRNFMVDLSSGFGITTHAPKHYIAVGCSFRI